MLYLFLGICASIIFTAVLMWYSEKADNDWKGLVAGILGILLSAVTFLGVIAFSTLAWHYKAAGYRAGIVNREYGTNYTAQELFYASDTIEIIRQLDRQRIELNGNLLKKEN